MKNNEDKLLFRNHEYKHLTSKKKTHTAICNNIKTVKKYISPLKKEILRNISNSIRLSYGDSSKYLKPYQKRKITNAFQKSSTESNSWAYDNKEREPSLKELEQGRPVIDDYTGEYRDAEYFDDKIEGVI